MNNITFSAPIHTGMDITVLNNSYRVYTPCVFLPSAVMAEIEKRSEKIDSILSDEGNRFVMESNTVTTVFYKGKVETIPLSKEELIKEILSSFKENALYWVAVPNYQRIMNNYPEKAEEYLTSLEDKKNEFVSKINKMLLEL